jgi:predicted negative regulator of RcsB-dependent stress response
VARKLIIAGVIAVATAAVVLYFLLGLDGIGGLMRRAAELREQGDFEQAADLFWQAAMMAPDSPRAAEALYEAGFTYYVVGIPKTDDARRQAELTVAGEQAFGLLIEKYPNSPHVVQARLELGKMYMEGEEFGKALEQLEAVVGEVKDPESRQKVCFDMAQCYERLGRIEMAVGRLKDIINLQHPGETDEEAHLVLARFYYEAGAHEQAVALLNQLLQGDVSFYTRQAAYTRLARYLLELNRFDEAIAALNEVEANPSNRALLSDLRDRISRRSHPGPVR